MRNGLIEKTAIAIYDYNGELEDVANTITAAAEITSICSASISKALKSSKRTCGHYFQYYLAHTEAPKQIEVPWLAQVDDIKFLKQTEIADYCGVSRRAVSQAAKRESSIINGREII